MAVKKYRFPIAMGIVISILYIINKELGTAAISIATGSLREMLTIIPPVFILLGLLDVWVPKESMVKYLGEGSGIKGIVLSFVIGSAAAGPLYGAFPIAAVLMKKGAKFSNVLIFIGAWSTTKIPMIMFEIKSLGMRFAMTRLIVDIIGIIIIAMIINSIIDSKEKDTIYENAKNF